MTGALEKLQKEQWNLMESKGQRNCNWHLARQEWANVITEWHQRILKRNLGKPTRRWGVIQELRKITRFKPARIDT